MISKGHLRSTEKRSTEKDTHREEMLLNPRLPLLPATFRPQHNGKLGVSTRDTHWERHS